MLKIIILGLLQGLTEFLPVSSSGHLVIMQNIFSYDNSGMTTEVFLHFGTLAAVILYFRRDLFNIFASLLPENNKPEVNEYREGKIILKLIVASIPAGIAGLLFKDRIELMFESPSSAYLMLIVTGIFLYTNKFFQKEKETLRSLPFASVFAVGVAQMFAIIPGISRSGATITAGVAAGMKKQEAARLSFLMMIPAVGGAFLIELMDFSASVDLIQVLAGTAVAFLSGFAALHILMKVISRYSIHVFAPYCFALGMTGYIITLVR